MIQPITDAVMAIWGRHNVTDGLILAGILAFCACLARIIWNRVTLISKRKQIHKVSKSQVLKMDIPYFIQTEITMEEDTGLIFDAKSLIRHLLKHRHNAFLISPISGMGKTTTLLKIWEYCTGKSNYPITIFIPLKDCNNNIFMYINDTYRLSKDDLLKHGKLTGKPKYIFLLDGLNEVDRSQVELIAELGILIRSGNLCILSSRPEDILGEIPEHTYFKKYFLSMPSAQIDKYCDYFKLTYYSEMKNVLTTPFMLEIFRQIRESTFTEAVAEKNYYSVYGVPAVTGSEVLWKFYLVQIEKAKMSAKNRELKKFALKKVLPVIAHHMVNRSFMTLAKEDVIELINTSLQPSNQSIPRCEPALILEILCYEISLLSINNESISFVHEEFRDFFAAIYMINTITGRIIDPSPIRLQIPEIIAESPPGVKRHFVGAIDADFFENLANDINRPVESRCIAMIALGDLFYYKAADRPKFPSRRTYELNDRKTLYDHAIVWYSRAAKLDEPMGYWNLGYVYRELYELEMAKNPGNRSSDMSHYATKALENTQIACNNLLPYGYNQMGVLYQKGIGVKKDIKKAIYYYKKGIEHKVPHSYNNLGKIYEDKVKEMIHLGNRSKAESYFKKAFILFYMQTLILDNEYGLNRVTCYYYEGIPINDETSKMAREQLGRFDVSTLPRSKKFHLLKNDDDTKAVMEAILRRAARAENKYAIARLKKLISSESQPDSVTQGPSPVSQRPDDLVAATLEE